MDQLIGAPLRATANANALMAKTQTQFMLDFCFTKKDGNLEPVMVDMVMTTAKMEPDGNEDGDLKMNRVTARFSLPLLTLIPITSLAVKDFEVDFDMEVTSVEREESSSESSDASSSNKKEVTLMGKVSNKSEGSRASNSQYQKKVDSKLSISVKGGQMPLPVGVTAVLDLYKNNVEPVEINKVQTNKTEEK